MERLRDHLNYHFKNYMLEFDVTAAALQTLEFPSDRRLSAGLLVPVRPVRPTRLCNHCGQVPSTPPAPIPPLHSLDLKDFKVDRAFRNVNNNIVYFVLEL